MRLGIIKAFVIFFLVASSVWGEDMVGRIIFDGQEPLIFRAVRAESERGDIFYRQGQKTPRKTLSLLTGVAWISRIKQETPSIQVVGVEVDYPSLSSKQIWTVKEEHISHGPTIYRKPRPFKVMPGTIIATKYIAKPPKEAFWARNGVMSAVLEFPVSLILKVGQRPARVQLQSAILKMIP